MGTRGVLVRHAREHGGVIAVVLATVLGVLVAGTFAGASSGPNIAGAPSAAVRVTVPPGANPATDLPSSPPPTVGYLSSTAPPPAATPGTPAAAPTLNAIPAAKAPAGAAVKPANLLPPLGDLSAVDQGIRDLCSTLLEPFGLYATAFGLVGAAIPFTLPELPFSILVGPISDLCLQLQGLAP